jgi:hypothetical protein
LPVPPFCPMIEIVNMSANEHVISRTCEAVKY